jgi:hypothetical protein
MIRLIAGFLARESAQRPENAGFLLGSGIAGDGNQQLSGSLFDSGVQSPSSRSKREGQAAERSAAVRRLAMLGCLALALSAAGLDSLGQDRTEPIESSPWIVCPSHGGQMSPEDHRARQALLDLIEKKQDAKFRKYYTVVVPEESTGLPKDYDILVYGQFLGACLLRLEVNVRGAHATGERVTADGFSRGPLPAKAIDELARMLIYGFVAEKRERPGVDREEGMTIGADHACSERIEIISRDPNRPFHLRTDAWKLLYSELTLDDTRVPGFAHTHVAEAIEVVCYRDLEFQKANVAWDREIVARLRRIETPKWSAGGKLGRYLRVDLTSIEAQLYSRLAVDRRLKGALPELRRLKLSLEAEELSIATAADPSDLLKAALTGKDWDFYNWSLGFVRTLPVEEQVEALLYAVPRAADECRTEAMLGRLAHLQLTAPQTAQVAKFFAETKGRRSKIAAAGALLMQTDESAYYEFLMQIAMRSKTYTTEDVYDPDRQATASLVKFSEAKAKRCKETAALMRTLLARIPAGAHTTFSGMDFLVYHLGMLGEPSDVPLLGKYADRDDAYFAGLAIAALARMSPKVALEKAHHQIDNYLKSREHSSFCWSVRHHFNLIFWQGDTSFAAPLEQALAKYRKERPDAAESLGEIQTLLNYLNAKNVDWRLQYALDYVGRRKGDMGATELNDVIRRLIGEGADPRGCEKLLEGIKAH